MVTYKGVFLSSLVSFQGDNEHIIINFFKMNGNDLNDNEILHVMYDDVMRNWKIHQKH